MRNSNNKVHLIETLIEEKLIHAISATETWLNMEKLELRILKETRAHQFAANRRWVLYSTVKQKYGVY